ncbi:MAG: signal recognition particle protein, partial [Nitrospinae bacterium]|nr:signal recognition particle protein [Nitrospinota bacterium]
ATLAASLELPLFPATPAMKPSAIVTEALAAMGREGANVLLIDTAGRLHIDDTLMEELSEIRRLANPTEILFVADAMTGQDAVTVARAFHERIGMTGVVLTKLDGDTRGGAALSVKKVTGAPIKFMGVGEKVEAFETFHPERMASRILGMGDVLTLIEQAQQNIDQKQAETQARKMLDASFDLTDFLEQIRMVRKMGPLDQLMKLIPGMGAAIKDAPIPGPAEIGQIEAIICSMTLKERAQPGLINTSRKRRIAAGSGTSINDVNKLLRQFQKSRKMMKSFGKMSKKLKGRPDMPNPFAGLGMGG